MKAKGIRTLAVLCCLCMLFSMTACRSNDTDIGNNLGTSNNETNFEGDNVGSVDVDNIDIIKEAKDDVVCYLTDGALKSTDVVMTVNGEGITASYLLYWIANTMTEYAYFSSDMNLNEEVDENGVTFGDAILSDAKDITVYYTALLQQSNSRELTLSDEQQEELNEYLKMLDDNTLLYYGTTLIDQETVYKTYLYSIVLQEKLYGEGGEYEITDDRLSEYMGDTEYFTIDYLYFGNSDDDASAAEASLEKAQDALDFLHGLEGVDFENAFIETADNADISETNYTFCIGGDENKYLENGVATMEIGEIGIIESDYGVYVVRRVELDTEPIKEQCSYDSFYSQLEQWTADSVVEVNENYEKIDVNVIFERLINLQTVVSANASEEETVGNGEDVGNESDINIDVDVVEDGSELGNAE